MRKSLHWVQWVSILTTLAVAVMLPILVVQGRDAAKSRDQGLRTFICYFEGAVPRSPKATRFFNGVLAKLHQPPCLK